MGPCPGLGPALSEGSPAAVGVQLCKAQASRAHPAGRRHGPTQKWTRKAPAFPVPRPLASALSKCVNLMEAARAGAGRRRLGGLPGPASPWGGGVASPPPAVVGKVGLLGSLPCCPLQCPAVTSGTRHLDHVTRGCPETTAEAPILPPNLHGAWPTGILHPPPARAWTFCCSLASLRGPQCSWIEVFFALLWSGRGWNCRELGCQSLSVKRDRRPGQGSC